MNKLSKICFLIIWLIWVSLLLSYIFVLNNDNDSQNSTINHNFFSEYITNKCPEWEVMKSWYQYHDWKLEIKNCTKPFSCPEWQELWVSCWGFLEYDSCGIVCHTGNVRYPG